MELICREEAQNQRIDGREVGNDYLDNHRGKAALDIQDELVAATRRMVLVDCWNSTDPEGLPADNYSGDKAASMRWAVDCDCQSMMD